MSLSEPARNESTLAQSHGGAAKWQLSNFKELRATSYELPQLCNITKLQAASAQIFLKAAAT